MIHLRHRCSYCGHSWRAEYPPGFVGEPRCPNCGESNRVIRGSRKGQPWRESITSELVPNLKVVDRAS